MPLNREALMQLEVNLQMHVAERQPPGLVAWVGQGEQSHVVAAGAAVLAGPAMPRDAIFRIASMTKPVVAAVAMMLVEEGLLQLDAPIERLAPELGNRRVLKAIGGPIDDTVPAERSITLEDVLSFRLGWGIDFEWESPFMKAVGDLPGFGMPNPAWAGDDDRFLQDLGRLPLQAQPGERWLYTLGANVLGVLVARAAGRPLDEVLRERVFDPLGMQDTDFFVPPDKQDRLVTGYVNEGGDLALFEPLNGQYARRPSFPAGDSGLVATADDYAAFARFMLSGCAPDGSRLLQAETLRAMTTNRLTAQQMMAGELILGPGRGWGLGLGVQVRAAAGMPPPGAFGWDGGFGTTWFNDPASGLIAILLTQRVFDGPDPPAVHRDFRRDACAAV